MNAELGPMTCVNCRFCGLRLDLTSGSGYFCSRFRRPLPCDVIHRKPCQFFIMQPPASHWGP